MDLSQLFNNLMKDYKNNFEQVKNLLKSNKINIYIDSSYLSDDEIWYKYIDLFLDYDYNLLNKIIFMAVNTNKYNIIIYILNKYNISPNIQNNFNETILHYIHSLYNINIKTVQRNICFVFSNTKEDNKRRLNEMSKYGWIYNNPTKLLDVMLEKKFDVDLKNENGYSFIFCCADYNMYFDRHEQIFLLSKNLNDTNPNGNTLLHLACHNNNKTIINSLIKYNVNPFIRNNKGLSCLDRIKDDEETKNIIKIYMKKYIESLCIYLPIELQDLIINYT